MSISEHFEAWPHDAEGIVREALREYVGDGDGEDEKVLAAYVDQERAAARREGQAEAWAEAVASAYLHETEHFISIKHDPNPYLEDRHVDQ